MLEKINKHHMIPVSILGPDIWQNIMSILQSTHNELHQILDMNSRLHYKLIRDAKLKTNHKIIMGPEDLKYRHDAQRLYFERVPRLDGHLRKLHLEKINQLSVYELERLKKIGIDKMHIRANTFDQGLQDYHDYQLELAKEINLIFKKGLGNHLITNPGLVS